MVMEYRCKASSVATMTSDSLFFSSSKIETEAFSQRCFSLIDEYASGFSSSIIDYDMLMPPGLEKEFGLTGGNIFHGAMGLDSLFLMRPVKGWSDYRTPLLYLCGSGTHPPGGGCNGSSWAKRSPCGLTRYEETHCFLKIKCTRSLKTNKGLSL